MLDIPVSEGMVGIIVAGGLNPLAAVENVALLLKIPLWGHYQNLPT
ncbi:MAG TPA: hypothetical protein DCY12_07685 [Candidatus Atribacteria bacterium]|nr:hypothetical protein [Candidatus Atribacteria bacterium]